MEPQAGPERLGRRGHVILGLYATATTANHLCHNFQGTTKQKVQFF